MPLFTVGDRLVEGDNSTNVVTPGTRFGRFCTVLEVYHTSSTQVLSTMTPGTYKIQFDGRQGYQTLSWNFVDKNFRKIEKAVEDALCR